MKILKHIGAVLLGLVVIFALSHITDLVLEKTGLMVIPFDQNPLWLMLAVTAYRLIYVGAGAYLTARLSPDAPMRDAMTLAGIGCILGILGAAAMWDQGAHWYPVSLIVLGWPAAWAGAKIRTF